MAEAIELSESVRLTKNKSTGEEFFPPAGQIPKDGNDSGDKILFVQSHRRAVAKTFAGSHRISASANNSALGCESASTKISQPPVAADAPVFLARAIWLIGSNTTSAPAVRAISAVRSVELLSHTINSVCQPVFMKTFAATLIWASDSPSRRSSLKAGMTMEIFIC